jgi:hypothetical protein
MNDSPLFPVPLSTQAIHHIAWRRYNEGDLLADIFRLSSEDHPVCQSVLLRLGVWILVLKYFNQK